MSEIPLHLVGDKEISVNPEMTILEAARKAGIPFKSACNGQAKCSTCRISVLEGDEHFLPRNPLEEALSLRRSFPCSVRLACQTRISGPARIRRMILEARDLEDIGDEALEAVGDEIKCAILFCDLRDFTPFVENNLAHDVVHILNRFFQHMGEAIVENEGEIDKYIGDAMLAVFHQGQNPALNACLAAKSMYRRLQELNPHLQKFFGLELKFGIGIHFGPVIRGRLGHQSLKSLTVIGESVNISSRIESETKACGVNILISDTVRLHVQEHLALGKRFERSLKGVSGAQWLWELVSS